jgi:PII-like signaling protein
MKWNITTFQIILKTIQIIGIMINLIPENSIINEQTKIATFLSTLDEIINQCQAQIEKTEVWKKGLLQQMFV